MAVRPEVGIPGNGKEEGPEVGRSREVETETEIGEKSGLGPGVEMAADRVEARSLAACWLLGL